VGTLRLTLCANSTLTAALVPINQSVTCAGRLAEYVQVVGTLRLTLCANSTSTAALVQINQSVTCAGRLVAYVQLYLFTVDIHSGIPGLLVLGHAQEELSNAHVRATEDEIAED